MFASERTLARWLIKAIEACNLSSIRDILPGDAMPKKPYENVLAKYFGSYAPMIMAKPDIVLIVEDHEKLIDEWLLIAVELKYLKKVERKRWREAYREVGQALRYYVYGFDSAILCHVFGGEIDNATVRAYSNVVGEVVEKLKLPIAYFSMKISDEDKDKFLIFKPLELSNPSDVGYIASWMIDCRRDNVRVRNPLLPSDKEVVDRRKALKTVLRVP